MRFHSKDLIIPGHRKSKDNLFSLKVKLKDMRNKALLDEGNSVFS